MLSSASALRLTCLLALVPISGGCSPDSPEDKAPESHDIEKPAPVLLGLSPFPLTISVSSTRVYWGDGTDNSIHSVALDASDPQVVATDQKYIETVVTDAGDVFWLVNGDDDTSLWKLGADATEPTQLYRALGYSASLAVRNETVYVAMARTNKGGSESTGKILAIPRAGGAPVTLAAGESYPNWIAADEGHVYWANSGTPGDPFAYPYFLDGAIKSLPLEGGEATTIVSSVVGLGAAAIVDGSIIFSAERTKGTSSLHKCATSGCGAGGAYAQTLVEGVALSARPWASGDSIYYVDGEFSVHDGLQTLKKISIDGGAPTTIVSDRTRVCALTGDATSLYWIEGCSSGYDVPSGGIWKFAR